MIEIGKRIKELRIEKELTQLEFANKINVSDRTVSKWEQGKGNPDIELLPNISSFFNVSIDFLITGKEFEKNVDNIAKDLIREFNDLIKPNKLNKYCERYIKELSHKYPKDNVMRSIDIFYEHYLKNNNIDNIEEYIKLNITKLDTIINSLDNDFLTNKINFILNILNKNDPDHNDLRLELKHKLKKLLRYLDINENNNKDKINEFIDYAQYEYSSFNKYIKLVESLISKIESNNKVKKNKTISSSCGIIRLPNNNIEPIKDRDYVEIHKNNINKLNQLMKRLCYCYDKNIDLENIPHISVYIKDIYKIFNGYLGRKNCNQILEFYNMYSLNHNSNHIIVNFDQKSFEIFVSKIEGKINRRLKGYKTKYVPNINLLMSYNNA